MLSRVFFILPALLLFPGLSPAAVSQLAPDFFLTAPSAKAGISRSLALPGMNKAANAEISAPAQNEPIDLSRGACLAHIREAVCETASDTRDVTENWDGVACNNKNLDEYAAILTDIYDELPAKLRPSFCTLKKIFVSDSFYSIAFAAAIRDPGENIYRGGFIGLRRGTLENSPTTRDLVSWKEQLNFGGSPDFLANDPSALQISYNLKLTRLRSDGLFYAVIHELGHLIDFNNPRLNEVKCKLGNCVPAEGAWGALSWKDISTPLPHLAYAHQKDFCYYACEGKFLRPEEAYPIYLSLSQSGFITTYSGLNLYEDFAEFFTWNLLLRQYHTDYRINVPGSPEIPMSQAITRNPHYSEKLGFMEKVWADPKTKVQNEP